MGKASVKTLKAKLAKAEIAARMADVRVDALRDALRAALEATLVRTADDYRLLISADDCAGGWRDEDAMLSDVQGSYTPDDACGATWQEHYKSKKAWLAGRAAVEAHNQSWIDAWQGQGISCWHGTLYVRDAVTGQFEEADSIGGFYAKGDWYSEDTVSAILEYVAPEGVKGSDIEIVSDGEIEALNGEIDAA